MRISLASARKLYRAVDTPRSLTCDILVRYGEYGQLANLRVDPKAYLDARSLQLDILATEFLRKHKDLPTGINKAKAAEVKYLEAERLCAKTNARFLNYRLNHFTVAADVALYSFVEDVKKQVSRVLGRVPDEVFPRFGPGATFDDRGQLTTVPDKMLSVPTISPKASCFLDVWQHTTWGREYLKRIEKGGRIRRESAGRFTTVPKDSTTDRAIDIQPSINVFYQLGFGSAMRNRLKRWGIDLDLGQDTHRRVACLCSIDGLMSTIDLSSASDTISKEVVRAVIPEEWYVLLDALRTTHSLVRGKRVYLEKFSAMGNGFTFELETLIFSCIVKVTLDRLGLPSEPGVDFLVYGDDIIVATEANTAVLSALRWFGFVPNVRKTFSEGLFRESCGGDYFQGQPVRGHYLKEEPNEPHQRIALANGIRRIIERFPCRHDVVRRRLHAVWLSVLDTIPSDIRGLRGPASLGDLVIHDKGKWRVRNARRPDVWGNPDRRTECSDIREICVWQPVQDTVPWQHWPSWVQYAAALYGVGSRGPLPRGGVVGHRRAWVALLEQPA